MRDGDGRELEHYRLRLASINCLQKDGTPDFVFHNLDPLALAIGRYQREHFRPGMWLQQDFSFRILPNSCFSLLISGLRYHEQ